MIDSYAAKVIADEGKTRTMFGANPLYNPRIPSREMVCASVWEKREYAGASAARDTDLP